MADERQDSMPTQTVGIIVIGDEILKGHTRDINSYFLLKRLWSLGVKVGKISVISDDEEAICNEVHDFSERFTFVITTGGIGPTHDDVTVSSIAKAFDEELVPNEELTNIIAQIYGVEIASLNSSHLKMAKLPPSGKLIYGNDTQKHSFPVISIHNVFVFPGVPQFLEKDFQVIEHVFLHPNCKKFHLCKIFLSVDETAVAHLLDSVDQKFKDSVHLGSYPDFCSKTFKVKLTLESGSEHKLQEACQYLLMKLPSEYIVNVEGLALENDDTEPSSSPTLSKQLFPPEISEVYSLLSPKDKSNVSACIKGAWSVIQESLRQYSLDELCISFNGGKDCTVLLHICYAAIVQNLIGTPKLNSLYIQHDSPFPEAEHFIEETTKRYNLNLITMKGQINEVLGKLKVSHPNIKAILMGTRRHDPFTEKLRTFTFTDTGWPEYMRINPILDWNHKDVWSVLLHCKVPYCSLYDRGYTSLGSTHNTKPNPTLKIDNSDTKYKPAYLLEDDDLERAGRM